MYPLAWLGLAQGRARAGGAGGPSGLGRLQIWPSQRAARHHYFSICLTSDGVACNDCDSRTDRVSCRFVSLMPRRPRERWRDRWIGRTRTKDADGPIAEIGRGRESQGFMFERR